MRRVRLTEGQLHNIIRNAVNQAINEDYRTESWHENKNRANDAHDRRTFEKWMYDECIPRTKRDDYVKGNIDSYTKPYKL